MSSQKIEKSVISRLKLQYQAICGIEDGDHVFVFRAPTRMEWRAYIDVLQTRKGSIDEAQTQLAHDCVVYPEVSEGTPDHSAFRAHIDKRPGLILRASEAISELAGLDDGVKTLKL